ncbi:AT-rich interactive domain-containing protein [Actinidia chinensis var. chinensis]|uniref:AT-rich interactive domain-containing protein n=1 Tax=Actinidia chinensis var. chinensis TaxID=1590841 RepID=A0A2R6RUG8_ACTCC|nr:AT-rich interactive domain-containing protein [Actinidia chinensis var. chinensis]
MVCKRPFHDEESYKVGCKHPRQHEDSQQSSIVGIAHFGDGPQRLFSDEGENSAQRSQNEGENARDMVAGYLNAANKDLEMNASGSISSYLWVNHNAIDEHAESDAAVHLSYFPHYFELDHHVTSMVQPHDIYSFLLDHVPPKMVPVGADHQADVPEWAPKGFNKYTDFLEKSDTHTVLPQSSLSCTVEDNNDWTRLAGTSVISTPDVESAAYGCCVDGGTRNYCNCLDRGSIRCVKQHVMETREELREKLGQKIFEELGFCDMGEEVAKNWTEEEEQTFHEVVLSNAASLGENFWDHLSAVFPSRTKRDLVSYYFNVFMLRKRAEQNRLDPLNIDSDNDEWQISEVGMSEEDYDSVVESLDQEATVFDQENHEEELHEGIEGETDTCKDDSDFVNQRNVTGEEDEGDIDDVSEAHVGNFIGAYGPVFQLSGRISSSTGEDQDIQDDSCTSYEYQCDKVNFCGPVDLRAGTRESSEE